MLIYSLIFAEIYYAGTCYMDVDPQLTKEQQRDARPVENRAYLKRNVFSCAEQNQRLRLFFRK